MFNRLLEILSDCTWKRIEEITPDLRLSQCLDEIGFAEMAFRIEDELGVKIPEEDLMMMHTVSDVWAFIREADRKG